MAPGRMLYYLHPDVSFFKGNGFKALGPYLDMPDNSAAGDVSIGCRCLPPSGLRLSCRALFLLFKPSVKIFA